MFLACSSYFYVQTLKKYIVSILNIFRKHRRALIVNPWLKSEYNEKMRIRGYMQGLGLFSFSREKGFCQRVGLYAEMK